MARENKFALVTGASRGIGRAIALRLARDGVALAINYQRDAAAAEAVVAQIEQGGGTAFAVQADVAEPGGSVRLIDMVADRFGALDILVTNAGVGEVPPLLATSEEVYDRLFGFARGVFFALQRAGHVLRDNGRIVVVSAIATRQPVLGPAYVGSKLAMEQFARTLAHEVGARGITVNAVLPGSTDTDMFAAQGAVAFGTQGAAVRERAAQAAALRRMGTAEEVAEVVGFLASDAARWVTGERIAASGGRITG